MKRALTAAALLGGLWLLAPAAQAQTGTARGKVLDAQGQPLADAKVVMEFQGGITRDTTFSRMAFAQGRISL